MIAVEYSPYGTVHWIREGDQPADGSLVGRVTFCGLDIMSGALWHEPSPGVAHPACKACVRAMRPRRPPELIGRTYYVAPPPPPADDPRYRVTVTGYAADQLPQVRTIDIMAQSARDARTRAMIEVRKRYGRQYRWEILSVKEVEDTDNDISDD